MINLMKQFLLLCGDKSHRIKQSVVFGFFDGIFEAFPFLGILYLFRSLESAGWKTDGLEAADAGITAGIFMVGVIGRWIMKYLVYTAQSVASYDAIAAQRLKVGDHLKRAPMGYFTTTSIGSTVTTLTDDMHYIEQNAANILEKTVNGCINVFVLTVGMMFFDLRVGIVFLVGSALSLIAISSMQKSGLTAVERSKESSDAANAKLIEYLEGLSVNKLFPGAKRTGTDINAVFESLRDASYGMERAFILKNLLFLLIERTACGVIIILTALFVLQGDMDMVKAVVLLVAAFVLYRPLESLGSITGMVRMMEVSLRRIEAMRALPVMNGGTKKPNSFEITLEGVSFQYESGQEAVIRDLSLHIPEHSMTAIVGASGCGKTTLVRLMARFWDTVEGTVRIGGVDVRDIEPEQIYSCFSIVFQNVFLFRDTIENNIKFGRPDATHEEVIAAAKKACCHDFIEQLPEGYETLVGENGSNLSGGEKQRISIARAILKDAPIILLDEATSSVDPENEWLLKRAINELVQGKTVVMIAHKMKTIMTADQIVVMDAGKIHGIGTHEELLHTDSIYAAFWSAREEAAQWQI